MNFAGGFWATVELLVALDATSQSHPFEDDVEDWLENVSSKVKMQLKRDNDSHKGEDEESGCEDSVDYGNLVECSFSYLPVKSRLEMLMGTNVVRLTDRKYMMKLIARIREDHENKQQARIEERKTRELMRTKKMILNRFIPIHEAPAEIHSYPLFQLYLYCDSISEQRQKKRISKKVKMPRSLYRQLYPEKEDEILEMFEEEEEIPMKEVYVDGVLEMVPLTRDELDAMAKKKELAEDIASGYMFSREEYEKLHYEAEAIKRLKETRTVNEMYARAHEIVGVLLSFTAGDRRKKCSGNDDESLASVSKSDVKSMAKSVGTKSVGTKSVATKSGKSQR